MANCEAAVGLAVIASYSTALTRLAFPINCPYCLGSKVVSPDALT